VHEARPETDHLFRTGGVQGAEDNDTKFYIGDLPFDFSGPIPDEIYVLLQTHTDLLDRYYDDEQEFIVALKTLANAFGKTAKGTYYTEDKQGWMRASYGPREVC
jgi:hypothetical protein